VQDARAFRQVMTAFPADVTVVTTLGERGRLLGPAAWLSCTLDDVHVGGDHGILIARVDDGGVGEEEALAFYDGAYRTAAP